MCLPVGGDPRKPVHRGAEGFVLIYRVMGEETGKCEGILLFPRTKVSIDERGDPRGWFATDIPSSFPGANSISHRRGGGDHGDLAIPRLNPLLRQHFLEVAPGSLVGAFYSDSHAIVRQCVDETSPELGGLPVVVFTEKVRADNESFGPRGLVFENILADQRDLTFDLEMVRDTAHELLRESERGLNPIEQDESFWFDVSFKRHGQESERRSSGATAGVENRGERHLGKESQRRETFSVVSDEICEREVTPVSLVVDRHILDDPRHQRRRSAGRMGTLEGFERGVDDRFDSTLMIRDRGGLGRGIEVAFDAARQHPRIADEDSAPDMGWMNCHPGWRRGSVLFPGFTDHHVNIAAVVT